MWEIGANGLKSMSLPVTNFELHYPSMDDMVKRLNNFGL